MPLRETLATLGGFATGAAVAYSASDLFAFATACGVVAVLAWAAWLARVRRGDVPGGDT